MCSAYSLRRATPTITDAMSLAAVEAASLGDIPFPAEALPALLARPEHHTYLAEQARQAVGFCSCLDTHIDGEPQLEIDLLGVLAEHRGRGVGRALAAMAIEEAHARGVFRARAIVQTSNAASLRALEAAGLRTEDGVRALLVCPSPTSASPSALPRNWQVRAAYDPHASGLTLTAHQDAQLKGRAAAIKVHTLAYSGLWIERLCAREAEVAALLARACAEQARARGLDETGYLCPIRRTEGTTPQPETLPFVRQGFRFVGYYRVLSHHRP